MARFTKPRNKIARRYKSSDLFGSARNPLLHKSSAPGMHGDKKQKKPSEYKLQCTEYGKLVACFGMLSRKQLENIYKKATRRVKASRKAKKDVDTNLAHVLLVMLETRLDSIVCRLFAPTMFAAHQLVAHGHVMVDGKTVDRRGFVVRPGMKVALAPKAQNILAIKAKVEASRELPDYLSLDKFVGTLNTEPTFEEISLPLPINLPKVCALLARSC